MEFWLHELFISVWPTCSIGFIVDGNFLADFLEVGLKFVLHVDGNLLMVHVGHYSQFMANVKEL